MKLVSRAQARAQIQSDTTDDDTHVELLISAASRAVMNYCNTNIDDFTDSAGEPYAVDTAGDPLNIPEDIQLATLYLVAWFYRNRDSDPDKEMPAGWLPAPCISLLSHYHDPALA
jgi:hypothetical protein